MSVDDRDEGASGGWTELATGVHTRTVGTNDSVNDSAIAVVVGRDGVLLWDTGDGSGRLVEALRDLGVERVDVVVVSHGHAGHTGGVTAVTSLGSPEVWAHEDAGVTGSAAAHTLSAAHSFDLGSHLVEVVHLGAGHTDGDLVAVVTGPDGGVPVVLAGDLVDGAGPLRYGPDCRPLAWPETLDLVCGLLTPETVVLPGHGPVVGRDDVLSQRADAGQVATAISGLHADGVSLEDAPERGDWPYPVGDLGHAVARGYAQLGRPPRPRLPLAGGGR